MEYISTKPDWDHKKILLIRLDRLGDLIVTTPLMQSIRNTYPNAQIDLLGSNLNKAFFGYCDYIDTTYCYDKNKPFSALKLFFSLRAQKYDVIINFVSNSSTANFFVQYLGATTKVCMPITKPQNSKYYTYASPHPKKKHLMEMFQEMAEKMNFEKPILQPIIPISPDKMDKVEREYPTNNQKMRIIISLGNIKRPHKRWSTENYAEIIKTLYEKYNNCKQLLDIFVMIGKSDLALLEELNAVPKEYYTLYVGTDIAESAALIDKSDLFICTSSGPSHIAASTSCPILSIINPYMYERWRPLRENDLCLVNENLQDIGIDEVLEKVEFYIDSWRKK